MTDCAIHKILYRMCLTVYGYVCNLFLKIMLMFLQQVAQHQLCMMVMTLGKKLLLCLAVLVNRVL